MGNKKAPGIYHSVNGLSNHSIVRYSDKKRPLYIKRLSTHGSKHAYDFFFKESRFSSFLPVFVYRAKIVKKSLSWQTIMNVKVKQKARGKQNDNEVMKWRWRLRLFSVNAHGFTPHPVNCICIYRYIISANVFMSWAEHNVSHIWLDLGKANLYSGSVGHSSPPQCKCSATRGLSSRIWDGFRKQPGWVLGGLRNAESTSSNWFLSNLSECDDQEWLEGFWWRNTLVLLWNGDNCVKVKKRAEIHKQGLVRWRTSR